VAGESCIARRTRHDSEAPRFLLQMPAARAGMARSIQQVSREQTSRTML